VRGKLPPPPIVQQPAAGQGHLTVEASRSHTRDTGNIVLLQYYNAGYDGLCILARKDINPYPANAEYRVRS
jgi:hypothetical protein